VDYDIIIKGGYVVDGSGNPWYKGDIAVKGDKIACISRYIEPESEHVIDATGFVVAPGFIDAHSHADSSTLFYREMESIVAQGITTVVAGQCGSSIAPINPSLRARASSSRSLGRLSKSTSERRRRTASEPMSLTSLATGL
jgi:N-acyl-D-amino-acid deacylase